MQTTPHHLKLVSMAILCCSSFSAFAISNGIPDCADNAANTDCRHPNVVMSSLFDAAGITIAGTRCSGTLIKADDDKAIILTAGHCTEPMVTGLVTGNFGVAFDAKINKVSQSSSVFDNKQFALGAIPILNVSYRPDKFYLYDFGAIVLPLTGGYAQTVNGNYVNVKAITPATLAPLGYLDTVLTNKKDLPIVDVGYGTNAISTNPNGNGNAATVVADEFGTRNISENGLFQNDNISGGSLLKIQGNMARDQSGICRGDSGGPSFHLNSNNQEVQIGIHSLGNNYNCNGYSGSYRIDIKPTQDFIACLMVDGKTINDLKQCGLTP